MAQRPSLHRYISALLAPIIIGALLVSPAHSERRHYSFGNPETKKKATSKQTAKFKKDMVKSSPARIVSLKNTVEVKSSTKDGWEKASANTALRTDDKVRTGPRSVARMQLKDGSKVFLLQNSEAEMEGLSTIQKTIKLVKGHIRAIVRHVKGGNQFQIKTPVGVASVRGTDFEVDFSADDQQMVVDVRNGSVGVSKLGELSSEVIVNGGEQLRFGVEGGIGDPLRTGAVPLERDDVRTEYASAKVKDSIVAEAAEELRNADYEVNKSLIDVNGQRVRIEEYITRPAANQFKLVSLNERPNRFDYFTYKGTFNQALPTDLSVALREVGGKLGTTKPDYYLTDYETKMSNTIDNITDSGTGGHLVKIDFDGTNYTLTDDADSSKTRTIAAAALQSDGSYKIYNPVQDTFQVVTAADRDAAMNISMLDSVTGSYRNLAASDIAWRTRFNSYTSYINTTLKTGYAKKSSVTNTLAIDLDSDFSNAPITTLSEYPSGVDNLHNRLSLYYSDGSKTTYDNYIIDDEGNVGPASAFSGISTGAAYRTELENWNFETVVTATEMGNRKIDLVIDPRIGTRSGLIQ